MPLRTCCGVSAGVHFFSPSGFLDQKPRRDQRERLMMLPADPVANFVVRQTGLAFGSTGHDAAFDDLHRQRSFGSIADFDPRPRRLRQRREPTIDTLPRTLSRPTSARGLGGFGFEVANERVARHGQQVTLLHFVQIPAKSVGATHFVVSRDPGVRQLRTTLTQHLQTQRVSRAMTLTRLGDARFAATFLVGRPLLGQIQKQDSRTTY